MTDNPLEITGPGRSGAWAVRMILAAVAVVAFVAVAGAVFWLSEQQARKMQVGIPDFSSQEFRLTDQSGASRSAADFAGAPVALFFGYTYCPDVCPMTLNKMDIALDKLKNKKKDIKFFFISVDPERDTPEIVKDYLSSFENNFCWR